MFSSSYTYCRFPGIQHVCMAGLLTIRIGDTRLNWKLLHVITRILLLRQMAHKRLRFEVLLNHNSGLVAAMTGPKDIAEYLVGVFCEKLETWRSGECSLKCHEEMTEITLQNFADRTRRVRTILRNTSRYSHDNLGLCESAIKELKKQVLAMTFHMMVVNHKCVRDRHAAWTNTLHSQR